MKISFALMRARNLKHFYLFVCACLWVMKTDNMYSIDVNWKLGYHKCFGIALCYVSVDRSIRCDKYVYMSLFRTLMLLLYDYLFAVSVCVCLLLICYSALVIRCCLFFRLLQKQMFDLIFCSYTHLYGVKFVAYKITLSCDYHDRNWHAPCNIWSIYPLCKL